MIRVLKILEFVWLAIAIFSLVMAIYLMNTEGIDQAKWFLLGTSVAIAFFVWRRRTRKLLEQEESQANRKP